MKKAILKLEDGTLYEGYSFGAEKNIIGEVVFNTAMNGYPESLSDPSYKGQIMVATYPMIGNYGIPSSDVNPEGISLHWESEKMHMQGIVVADYAREYSHWNAVESLASALRREGVVGIGGIDTRALTKHLREKGAMKGTITIEGVLEEAIDEHFEERNLVAETSCKEVVYYGSGEKKVVLLDCGVKHNIIRRLLCPEITVIRVPWDYDFNSIDFDGLFISNGPGDPNMCEVAVEHIRTAFTKGKPIYGICMGHQLLSLAAGAKIFKLKYGHRSYNQPVRMAETHRCFITSQNHSFAVDTSSLSKGWKEWFFNLNDGTNEGICHESMPYRSVQFHPEACGGPHDTFFIFDDFIQSVLNQ